jgi:hypothetical protein
MLLRFKAGKYCPLEDFLEDKIFCAITWLVPPNGPQCPRQVGTCHLFFYIFLCIVKPEENRLTLESPLFMNMTVNVKV